MITLAHVASGDPALLERNFRTIARLTPDAGGLSIDIRSGTGVLTFTSSARSATLTVTHGIGRTPVVTLGAYNDIIVEIVSKTDQTFTVEGWVPSGAGTFDLNFDWIAVG